MSRVTIEDCLAQCPNHFTLTYRAASRAHQILRRGDARVTPNNDRPVAVALREIAQGAHEAPPMEMDAPAAAEAIAAAAANAPLADGAVPDGD